MTPDDATADDTKRATPARYSSRLQKSVTALLDAVYPDLDTVALRDDALDAFWGNDARPRKRARAQDNSLWSERDVFLISYGNSIVDSRHNPLDLLYDFLHRNLRGCFNGIHILPYFPYTSDDGFAVTQYCAVDSQLGSWGDIQRIAGEFRLMSDLVLNHCSSQGPWFSGYLQGHEPYDRFFVEAPADADLSEVVRPRAHPLLREVETANGTRHVWCTFSHDQVDLNFANPEVLLEFLRIMRFHIDRGVRVFRLDAVAFLWKRIGTPCINLPQTHQLIRLLRVLADYSEEALILITETNLPNKENLSYFGNLNEAHAVYNFSLPPLLLHALLNGNSKHLNEWQMSMPPAQSGCSYLNFSASHDGIGLRPAEGLIPEAEIANMIDTVKQFGALISERKAQDGAVRPYEINVSLFDGLRGTVRGEDQWNVERFLCSQAITLALEGIPAIYIHSLLATANDHEGVHKSQHNRAINRRRWHYPELQQQLADPGSTHARVFAEMRRMIGIRIKQPAFHPSATQFTLQLGEQFFGFWRQSKDRAQSVFAIHNLTDATVTVPAYSLNLIDGDHWFDLLSGDSIAESSGDISFSPYQCRWITNRQQRS